jgi:general secretion pathway protein D
MNQNWDQAIEYLEKAIEENPTNSYYRLALLRAQLSAAGLHMNEARRLAAAGKVEEALAEYDKALFYDPDSRLILNEAQRLIKQQEQPEEALPVEMLYAPPVKLAVSDQPITLKFPRDVSLKSIFQALAKYSEVNIIFDDGFRDKPFSIDLTDMSFEQALDRLCMASKHFFRIVDSQTVLVLVDQPQNRMKYEQVAIKTFYLTNIDAQEVQQPLMQMIRAQQSIPQISHNKAVNSITIRTTPDRLKLAEQIIRLWDKPKGEVMVELQLMEVSRQKLSELGLELDNYGIGVAYTQGVTDGWANLGDLDFGNADNYSIAIPNAFVRFLETDVESKFLARPQLRGVHGEKIEYMVGDEVPIPNSTFQAFAGGGIASTPVVSYDYKPVGIEISITPTIHSRDEVTLELDVKIKALAGSGYADLPVITTRQIKNIIRLRDGETNLLAGLLKDVERTTLKGIPGIKEIPIIGALFSYTDQEVQQTDVIMTITPHIIRSLSIGAEDQMPLWLPLEGISGDSGGGRLPRVRGMVPSDPTEDDAMMDVIRDDREPQAEGSNRVTLSPPGFETSAGREARVNVGLASSEELQNMTLNMTFDPQVLKLKAIVRGNVLSRLGDNPSVLENIDNASGTCIIGFSAPLNQGVRGSGNIVTLVFEALAPGESQVAVSSISANSTRGQPVSFDATTSNIRIR